MANRYIGIAVTDDGKTNIPGMGHDREELTGAVESDVIINGLFHRGVLMAFEGSGSGKLQYTFSSLETVLNDEVNIDWQDWEPGTVNANTSTVIETAIAFKYVNISGTNKYTLIGERTV
jgi:hypothetical protein